MIEKIWQLQIELAPMIASMKHHHVERKNQATTKTILKILERDKTLQKRMEGLDATVCWQLICLSDDGVEERHWLPFQVFVDPGYETLPVEYTSEMEVEVIALSSSKTSDQ